MKKFLVLLLVSMLAVIPVLASAQTLTMGSWRADDVEAMNALFAAYKELTGVEIIFQPTNPPEYNAALRLQLDNGTGPDLMYARSYATGRELYEAGFFADCSEIEGVQENFVPSSMEPWQAEDGTMFAVPFLAVSHAVYYNQDIFAEQGLEVPGTWEEFIAVCEALKAAGITPLANGVKDEWDILETFFLGMLPNYVGGAEERAKYESGEKKLNDEAFVAAYTDMAAVAPYLDENFASVDYNDSQIMFGSGRAAMFIDGSWTAGTYGDVDFNWSVFAIPAPEGKATAICFHPDAAITMNTATQYPEEAAAFLAWIATVDGATTVAGQYMPQGFFPMINAPIQGTDPHANAFLALNEGKETDARFIWPAMTELYDPMIREIIDLLKGEKTPQEAADAIQAKYEELAAQ